MRALSYLALIKVISNTCVYLQLNVKMAAEEKKVYCYSGVFTFALRGSGRDIILWTFVAHHTLVETSAALQKYERCLRFQVIDEDEG